MTSSTELNAGGMTSSWSRPDTAPPFSPGGAGQPPAPPWWRSAEQLIQIAGHAVLDDRAHRVEGALLGVARRARVAEDVVGDPVHIPRVALDLLGLLVELRRPLAEAVLDVTVLVHVGELLRDAHVAQQPDSGGERGLRGLHVGHAVRVH